MNDMQAKPQTSAPAADAAPAPTAACDTKRDFISHGEHIHKWGTYLGVDSIFNTAAGVSFAYLGKYTEVGQTIWSRPITKAFTKVLGLVFKDEEHIRLGAKGGNIFMSVIAGGMFTIPPLMALEHPTVRKSIVKHLDELIYGKEKVANDPRFQKTHSEIEQEPKKDFKSGVTSRFCALAPLLLAAVVVPQTRKFIDQHYFRHIRGVSQFVAEKIGISPKSFKSLAPQQARERLQFIHESLAMDLGLSVPYAGLHSYFYNKFASRKAKAAEGRAEIAPEAQSEPEAEKSALARGQPMPINHAARLTPRMNYAERAAMDTSAAQDYTMAR